MLLFSFLVSRASSAANTPYRFTPTQPYPNEVPREFKWPTPVGNWPTRKSLPERKPDNDQNGGQTKNLGVIVGVPIAIVLIIVTSIVIIFVFIKKRERIPGTDDAPELHETIVV